MFLYIINNNILLKHFRHQLIDYSYKRNKHTIEKQMYTQKSSKPGSLNKKYKNQSLGLSLLQHRQKSLSFHHALLKAEPFLRLPHEGKV